MTSRSTRAGRGSTTAMVIAVASLVASFVTSRASADEGGLGERAARLVTVESVLGSFLETFSANGASSTYAERGLFPGGFASRFGVHFALEGRWTIGARFGAWAVAPTASSHGDTRTFVELSPRFGVIGRLSRDVALWARVGPSFMVRTTDESEWYLDASMEALVVLTPATHVGLFAGPTADIGLTGAAHNATQTFDRWGFTAGVLTDF